MALVATDTSHADGRWVRTVSEGQLPLIPAASAPGGAPRQRRRRPAAAARPVAQVALLTPLPHLDRLFDYEVPEHLAESAAPGARVRVRLAGRLVDGFILARAETSLHDLQQVSSVHGPPVLTPEIARLCRSVADRYAGTLADVLRFAVPSRHARAERRKGDRVASESPTSDPVAAQGWAAYHGGPELLGGIGGESPRRGLWISAPAEQPHDRIAELVGAVLARGRGVLVLAPDRKQVDGVCAALTQAGVRPTRLLADSGPESRYRAFLSVLSGAARVVVGTRAAVFAPVVDLGAIIVWDDGDESFSEPQAPGWHAREVAALRSAATGCSLVVGSPAVSLEAARMASTGWLAPVAASRQEVRARMPRVQVAGDLAADPARSASRVPSVALEMLREALTDGPALVSVPRAGYLPTLACQACRERVICPQCTLPLRATGADRLPTCPEHGVIEDWSCPVCGRDVVRAAVVGVRRTAEEFGRALPGVRVMMASSEEPSGAVTAQPALVVATPGSEPVPGPAGYRALLILDASAALSRPGLRVAEEVLRRWFHAAALVRRWADGGRVLVVGESDQREVQALVRWDPHGYASRELAERAGLQLPPAVRTAQLTGPPVDVLDVVQAVDTALGSALLRRSGPLPGPEDDVTWLLAASIADGPRLTSALQAAQVRRSARRAAVVGVRLDPPSLR